MEFTEFQEKSKNLIFSRRQLALQTLEGLVSVRMNNAQIPWPDLMLYIEPADFDIAYTLAAIDRTPMKAAGE